MNGQVISFKNNIQYNININIFVTFIFYSSFHLVLHVSHVVKMIQLYYFYYLHVSHVVKMLQLYYFYYSEIA